MKRFILFLIMIVSNVYIFANEAQEIKPYGAVPTANQLRYMRQELDMFVHFTVNQYTGREWGDGTESPSIFNPFKLDTDQWARVAKETGFPRIVLTAKHHDGFCLWPSKYTDHSVASSPYKEGKGDILREFTASCEKYGIEKGFYLSPWDRNSKYYNLGQAYNDFYFNQLRELVENYGEVTEMWFDGARGEASDQTYEFNKFWGFIREKQPKAVIFSDVGPDVRWIGNERGYAGETFWNTIDSSKYGIGDTRSWVPAYLNVGEAGGPDWRVGQSDTSIRGRYHTKWFWHKDDKPKKVKDLVDIYFGSVGRGSVLMLNVPPTPEGLFDDRDVAVLYEFRKTIDEIFSKNLIDGATLSASNVRGGSDSFSPQKLIDGDLDSHWGADDALLSASVEIKLPEARKVNVISLSEPIALGQRIAKFRVEVYRGGRWKVIARETTIGNKRLLRVNTVTSDRFRVVVEDSLATVCLSEIGLFYEDGRLLAKK
ncbi:MAG: alpha-L-fucosidase [Spirochaetales bacterium]|nr:alpha-L-fucosidase [Spirochaetales bacterium]